MREHSSKNRLYRIWSAMKSRCHNPNVLGFSNYGGRGISVCSAWQDYVPFMEWAIANGYEEHLTLDRIDVNGNYCPENCRWATYQEQANNTRSNRLITFNGKTMTSRQWDREHGFRQGVISDRINTLGWSVERALTEETGCSAKRYTYKGENLPLSEWARRRGLSYSTLWRRVEVNGESIAEVMETPVRGERNLLTFEGRTMPLCEWAKEKEIPFDTLWKRIKDSGWNAEKALSTPVRHYNRKLQEKAQ